MNRHQLRKREVASMQWMWVNWMTERKLPPAEPKEHFLDKPSGSGDYTIWEKFEALTGFYQASTSEITRSRKFVDEKVHNTRIEREEVDLEEMIEWDDLRWRRNDIPDIVTFWEQGGSERQSEWLDGDCYYATINGETNKEIRHNRYDLYVGRNQKFESKETDYIFRRPRPVGVMNDRDFRERCTIVGNTLQPVYIRSCEDDLRIVHDPEWIADQLDCELIDAMTYAECFRRFGIDRNTVFKLINGYWDNRTSEWKSGLGKIGTARGSQYAELLEKLAVETSAITDAEELQMIREYYLSVSQDMVATGDWCLQYGTHNPYWNDQMAFIEESVTIVDDPDGLIVIDEVNDDYDGFISPFGDEEVELPQGITATWRLYDGSETLDHHTICRIKVANIENIGIIIRRMFPQGRKRAEWGFHHDHSKSGFMTLSQTRQAWWYINERREQLAIECEQYMTFESEKVLGQVRTMPKPQARAYVATYCAGNAFNMYGREITWKHRPCAYERYAIWAKFRQQS
jgi:hypothetical protein